MDPCVRNILYRTALHRADRRWIYTRPQSFGCLLLLAVRRNRNCDRIRDIGVDSIKVSDRTQVALFGTPDVTPVVYNPASWIHSLLKYEQARDRSLHTALKTYSDCG
jgi:hypothetical protein